MRRRSAWAWLLTTLVVASPPSCSKTPNPSVRRNPPPDPLLLSKTPAKSNYGAARQAHPWPDPTPPAMPAGAWVANPAVPGTQPGPSEPPPRPPFRWTSEKQERDGEQPQGKMQSLQGTLERLDGHRWLLNQEGTGDRFLLQGHPRLDMLEPGDSVRVEGHRLSESQPRAGGAWLPHPVFTVQRIQLVQRGL